MIHQNIGEGISSKKQKTGGGEEATIEHKEGRAPSYTTNSKNTKLSLFDQAKSKVDSSCAGVINILLV